MVQAAATRSWRAALRRLNGKGYARQKCPRHRVRTVADPRTGVRKRKANLVSGVGNVAIVDGGGPGPPVHTRTVSRVRIVGSPTPVGGMDGPATEM